MKLTKVDGSPINSIMEKQLNIKRIVEVMDELGFNQARLAKDLGVSRTIVSSWFKGRKFPRPAKLLKLGFTLGLPFQDMVQKFVTATEPVVAFRKKGRRKTTDTHITNAKEMGLLLELLVPYLPFDGLFQPPVLKKPRLEYSYIQKAAARIRSEIGVKNNAAIDFEQLIKKLNEFEVILIPVFHGQKEHHENALHIYLPNSKTTWIYLNLDSNIHDFKFWMAHELGHVLSPSLTGETAEDFADAFAQALLFPKDQAKAAYKVLKRLRSAPSRIKHILHLADSFIISPITIYMAINGYAMEKELDVFELEPDLYAVSTSLNKKYPNVSETLNESEPFTASEYMQMSKKLFQSSFFKALRVYLFENEKPAGFIQLILDTSIFDAREIHAELVKDVYQGTVY